MHSRTSKEGRNASTRQSQRRYDSKRPHVRSDRSIDHPAATAAVGVGGCTSHGGGHLATSTRFKSARASFTRSRASISIRARQRTSLNRVRRIHTSTVALSSSTNGFAVDGCCCCCCRSPSSSSRSAYRHQSDSSYSFSHSSGVLAWSRSSFRAAVRLCGTTSARVGQFTWMG